MKTRAAENITAQMGRSLVRRHAFVGRVRWDTVFVLRSFFTAACIFFIASYLYPIFVPQKNILVNLKKHTAAAHMPDAVFSMKPLEAYRQHIGSRQVFKSISGTSGPQVKTRGNPDLIKNFALLGIVTGEPLQAIIEDKKAHKTYYVVKGQALDVFTVEDIASDKVILSSGSQQYELYL